jgi:hypothetical protein
MKASCVSKGQAKYYRRSIGRFEWEAETKTMEMREYNA